MAVVAFIALAAGVFFQQREKKSLFLSLPATAAAQDLEGMDASWVVAPGIVEPLSRELFLGFDVSGVIGEMLVEEGDKVEEAGVCFDVLHTPGHTPGSVCYLHDKSLFCGDTLFYQGYGRVDLAGGSEKAMMESLARLMKLPDDTVCYPGHGMKTKIA